MYAACLSLRDSISMSICLYMCHTWYNWHIKKQGQILMTRNYELEVKDFLETQSLIQYKQLKNMKISSSQINILLNKGILKRLSRGVYSSPHMSEDRYLELQSRYSQIVFSHETALKLHGMIGVSPNVITVTVPRTYNYQYLVKEAGLNAKRSNIDRYPIGIINIISPGGNPIKIYNKERTLCDIISKRNRTDLKDIHNAFASYFESTEKDLVLLLAYAKIFKVENEVRLYMDALI